MGGIGISMNSQEGAGFASKPLTNLPQKVVDEIARKLGISANAKQSLAAGKIDLPDDVDVKITRLSNNSSLSIKKLQGGAQYTLTYGGTTVTINP